MTDPASEERDRADMARLAAGQDAGLNDLMARYSQPIYHYLLRLLQNEAAAADLAEESFVRVYLHRARFRLDGKFSTWLYTIATNLARDRQRHAMRHPQVSLEAESPTSEHSLIETLSANSSTPREALESAERAEAVRRAIAGLPEDLRGALVLTVYENKSHAEVAEILGCSAKAVEMRVYRARQEMRQRLQPLLA